MAADDVLFNDGEMKPGIHADYIVLVEPYDPETDMYSSADAQKAVAVRSPFYISLSLSLSRLSFYASLSTPRTVSLRTVRVLN